MTRQHVMHIVVVRLTITLSALFRDIIDTVQRSRSTLPGSTQAWNITLLLKTFALIIAETHGTGANMVLIVSLWHRLVVFEWLNYLAKSLNVFTFNMVEVAQMVFVQVAWKCCVMFLTPNIVPVNFTDIWHEYICDICVCGKNLRLCYKYRAFATKYLKYITLQHPRYCMNHNTMFITQLLKLYTYTL